MLLACLAVMTFAASPASFVVGIRSAPDAYTFDASYETLTQDTILWRFDSERISPQLMQRQLEAQPWVRVVEANLPLQLQMRRDDTVWASRDLRDSQSYLRRLSDLLQQPGGGAVATRPRIAMIDTGVDVTHPDLDDNIGEGINLLFDPACDAPCTLDATDERPMDYNGHGTAIAGLIGAEHNDIGVDGLNDTVQLMPIKAFDAEGRGSLAHVLRGLEWARVHRAQIVNLSFGTPVYSKLLAEAVTGVQRAGALVVAAAGNQGAGDVLYPARFSNVIAVGSINAAGISSFSNVGDAVSVYAPGEGLMSTQTSVHGPNVYAPVSGTSAAAAYMTGLMSQVIASRKDAAAARAYLREHTLLLHRNGQLAPTVNAPLLLANLQKAAVHSLTALRWDAPTFARPNTTLRTRLTIINSGNVALARQRLRLRVQRPNAIDDVELGVLPVLGPGKSIERRVDLPLPVTGLGREDLVLRLSLLGDAGNADEGVQLDSPALNVTVTAEESPSVRVDRIWLATAAPTLPAIVGVQVRNNGNVPLPPQRVQTFLRPAAHEGIFDVEPVVLSAQLGLPALAPGAVTTVRMPLLAFPLHEARFSIEATLSPGAGGEEHVAVQSFEQSPTGELMPQYSGDAHVASVATAVDLLRLIGHEVDDVHADDAAFAGTPETTEDFGAAGNLSARRRGWRWSEDWPKYPAQSKTLLDGARACDAVDVVYGDYGAATWNSHFWIVDENDHVGLGNHSAYDKIVALMMGGGSIEDGAIAAYNNGDKARAWWLVGHAAHLIGDLSTAAHTLNRNWHGVVGDAFHDWLGHNGRWQGWTATHALQSGGMVDPYDSRLRLQTTQERLRYLAYGTAQVGSAFPWRRTRSHMPAKGPREGQGNRVLGGDEPHYDTVLAPVMASLTDHPLTVRDIDLDEVMSDEGICKQATGVARSHQRRDCWDGGDDHVCVSNTAGGGNDVDGDMSRIADASYVYALRSIAGLLYLFARETGQI